MANIAQMLNSEFLRAERAETELATLRATNERLRAALREHACECVSVCMDAKHNYGEIDTPDTCKYGRAALALAQEKPNDRFKAGTIWWIEDPAIDHIRADVLEEAARVIENNCHDDMTRAEEAAAIRALKEAPCSSS